MPAWFFIILIFLAIFGLSSIMIDFLDIEFGAANYWDHHGLWFLFFIAAFPRLTLLFSNVASGGFFWWLAWLFAPRYLVAILATIAYWNQNKFLVFMSWLIALGGESSEKYVASKKVRSNWTGKTIDVEYTTIK